MVERKIPKVYYLLLSSMMSRNFQKSDYKKNLNKKGAINPKEKQQIAGLDANFRMGIEQFLIEFVENEELIKYVRDIILFECLLSLLLNRLLMFLFNY